MSAPTAPPDRRGRGERGQVLAVVVLFVVPVFVAALAFSADMGRTWLVRSAYQSAASLAAEAGAGELDECALASGELVLYTAETSCGADQGVVAPGELTASAEATDVLDENLKEQGLPAPSGISVVVEQDGHGGGACDERYTRTCYDLPTVVVAFTAKVGGLAFAAAAFHRSTQDVPVAVAATASEAAVERSSGGG